MTAVDRVKELCKDRNIPISKLERACGFSNGYIAKLKKGTMPNDKLQIVADYFNVSVEYLMTGEDQAAPYYLNDETRELAQFLFENPNYKVMFDAVRKVKPEDIEFIRQMIDRASR